MLTNHEHRISYDSTGRLISKELLDLSVTGNGDKWLHSLEYNYDADNNVTHFAFADKNRSFVTAYQYGKDNLLAKTTLPNNNQATTQPIVNNIQESTSADELKKYKELLDSGVITQEEFDAKKKQLLGL